MLAFDSTITLYHTDDAHTSYVRTVLSPVSLWRLGAQRTIKGGAEDVGRVRVRIPDGFGVTISPGDYLVPGNADAARPDHLTRLQVTEVSDNRRGVRALWHWRVDAI